jgi:hypothetical protein
LATVRALLVVAPCPLEVGKAVAAKRFSIHLTLAPIEASAFAGIAPSYPRK